MNVRPVKLAYFVGKNDRDGLARALGFLCTQWGGIRSIIIPVGPDMVLDPFFDFLLRLHEPDIFVSYLSGGTASGETGDPRKQSEDLLKVIASKFPSRHIVMHDSQPFERYDQTAHPLNVLPDNILKSGRLKVFQFDASEEDYLSLLSIFGEIWQDQQEDYSSLMSLESVPISMDDPSLWALQIQSAPLESVINLTGYGVSMYKATDTLPSAHFDIVVTSSPTSLCYYWDMRATRECIEVAGNTRRKTLLLPLKHLTDSQKLQNLVDTIRQELPFNSLSTNLHMRFYTTDSCTAEELDAALSGIRGVERFRAEAISLRPSGRRLSLASFDEPLTYLPAIPQFPTSYFEAVDYQPEFPFEPAFGRNEVMFSPPSGVRNRLGGAIALDLQSDIWLRYPTLQSIASAIKQEAWFSRYGVSFLGGVSERNYYMNFNLPGEWEVLTALFGASGYSIRESRPGAYASALVDLLADLRMVDVLASKGTYRLLETLSVKSTKKLAQRIVRRFQEKGYEISDSSVDELQRLVEDADVIAEAKPVVRTYKQLCQGEMSRYRKNLLNLLERLSQLDIIKRGFTLVCPKCEIRSWHPLRTLGETVVCPGCSFEFHLPVKQAAGTEIEWDYTLNSLVNRVMDQDVLPVVIALAHLTKNRGVSSIVPGLELLRNGNVEGEFDFVFVSDCKLHVGECKAAGELREKDMDTARLAVNAGAHQIYFCTVSTFSDESKRLVTSLEAELAGTGSPVTVSLLEEDKLLRDSIDY